MDPDGSSRPSPLFNILSPINHLHHFPLGRHASLEMKARDLRASIFDLAASSATVPRCRRSLLPRLAPGHRECMRRDSLEPVYEAASRYALEYVFGRKPAASR